MNRRALRQRTAGTSIVEFALVAPMFLLLTLGFVQLAMWALSMTLSQLAADDAAHSAAGAYLAQYKARSWEQATDGNGTGSWTPIYATAGFTRGKAVLDLLRLTSRGLPYVRVRLVEQGISPGEEGTRLIQTEVIVKLPRLLPLVAPPSLLGLVDDYYVARSSTRTTRFYSY